MKKIIGFLVLFAFILIFSPTNNLLNAETGDTEPPIFDSIPDQTIEVNEYTDIDWTTYITNLSDNSGGVITTIEVIDNVLYDTLGTYSVTVSAIDSSNNENNQTFNVEVIDTTPPSFDEIEDQYFGLYYEGSYDWLSLVENLSDNANGNIELEIIYDNVDFFTIGEYLVTIVAYDESFNIGAKTFNVIVLEDLWPDLTIDDTSSPVYVEVNTEYEDDIQCIDYLGQVCDVIKVNEVDTTSIGTYDIEYGGIDMWGNNANPQFITVYVVDTTPPTFDISDQTIEIASEDIDWTTYITNANDNYSNQLIKSELEDNVNYNNLGVYTVRVSVEDENGNVTEKQINVSVVDNEAPTFSIQDSYTFEKGINPIDWNDYLTNINDNSNDNLKILIEDNIDYNAYINTNVTITISDNSNNSTSKTISVYFQDTSVPTYSLDLPEWIELGSNLYDFKEAVKDRFDYSGVVYVHEISNNIDYYELGTYTVELNICDKYYNNCVVETINIEVLDTSPPIIFIDSVYQTPFTFDVGYFTSRNWLEDVRSYDNENQNFVLEIIANNVDFDRAGEYEVVFRASDDSGNQSFFTLDVSIVDVSAPLLRLSEVYPSISIDSDVVDWSLYIDSYIEHSDSERNIYEVSNDVDYSKIGGYTVVLGAQDDSGNESTITLYPRVIDDLAPTFSLPNKIQVEVNTRDIDYISYVTDAFDHHEIELSSFTEVYSLVDPYDVTITARDSYGNFSSKTMTIEYIDTLPPTFTVTDQVIEINDPQNVYIDWTDYVENVRDNNGDDLVLLKLVETNVDYNALGDYTVKVKAFDQSNNETIKTFTVSVVDTTPPNIFSHDRQILVNEDPIDWLSEHYTVFDNASALSDITVRFEDNINYDLIGNYTVTYYATDQSGNEGSKSIQVNVADITPPQIILHGDSEITHEIYTAYTEPVVEVIEFYDSDVELIVTSSLNVNRLGVYFVYYDAIDSSGNKAETVIRIISVVDTEAPTLTLIGEEEITLEVGSQYIEKGASYTDNYGVNQNIMISGNLQTNTVGTYSMTYDLTDIEGNHAKTIVRRIHVVDTTAPTFTINNQVIELGSNPLDWTDFIEDASDNYSLLLTSSLVKDNVDYDSLGTYSVIVSLNDEAGNITEKEFFVTVVDKEKPMVNGINEDTLEVNTYYSIDWFNYIVDIEDNVSDEFKVSMTYNDVQLDEIGTYSVILEIMDENSNITEYQIVVNIVDTTSPTFVLENQTIEVGLADINWTTYLTQVSDNYSDEFVLAETEDNINYDTVGQYSVKVSVSDQSGNMTEKEIIVTVVDTEAPTFDDIEDQTIEAGSGDIDWTSFISNASDNYSTTLTLTEEDVVDYHTVGTYQVTVTVGDEFENVSSKTFTVNVTDTTSPIFSIEDQTIEAGSEDIDWTTYIKNANDNASGDLIYTEVIDNVIYNTPGTYTVTVKVIDASSNETEKSINVEVVDTTPPTYNITIEAGLDDIEWTEFITDTNDNVSGDLLTTEVEDNIDYNTPGTYTVLLSVSDENLNESLTTLNITVQDTIKPQVSLNPSLDSIELGSTYTEYGVTPLDVTDTSMIVEGEVDTSTPGVYELSYVVTDTSGNETIIKRYVTVYEKQIKVEFNLGDAQTTILTGDEYIDGSCDVTIDGETYSCEVKENNVDTTTQGVYWIWYAYTYEGKEYTYRRFVVVLESYEDIQAYVPYLPIVKEDDEQ